MTPEGTWREIPPVDGAFVINIGDLMARWTNDRWVSTLHRVVNVPPNKAASTAASPSPSSTSRTGMQRSRRCRRV